MLSPEITNEQTQLGNGGVMTLGAAEALSQQPMPRNVFLVALRRPVLPAALATLRRQFPGTVLSSMPPPEVRDLSGVSGHAARRDPQGGIATPRRVTNARGHPVWVMP